MLTYRQDKSETGMLCLTWSQSSLIVLNMVGLFAIPLRCSKEYGASKTVYLLLSSAIGPALLCLQARLAC